MCSPRPGRAFSSFASAKVRITSVRKNRGDTSLRRAFVTCMSAAKVGRSALSATSCCSSKGIGCDEDDRCTAKPSALRRSVVRMSVLEDGGTAVKEEGEKEHLYKSRVAV